jgi:uncharacterized membrane protein
MTAHLVACVVWFLLHVLVAGRWRQALVARFEETGFRLLFSLLSIVSLAAVIATYVRAPEVVLWAPSLAMHAVAAVIMLPAFLLMVTSLRPSNPTLAGADMLLGDLLPTVGITRVTRHPMLWAFALWAVAHMLANGDAPTLLLAGTILLTAVNGMFSIDRKKRHKLGAAYVEFESKTSILPFAAILGGRNELRLREIGGVTMAGALLLYLAAFWLHGWLGAPIVL